MERSTVFTIIVYFTEILTVCTLKKNWDVLEKAGSVGSSLCHGYNDCKSGLYLSSAKQYRLTVFECGIIEEPKTFRRFTDSKRQLDRSQFFNMKKCKKTSALLPSIWKKTFNSGIVIPAKMRFCNKCDKENCCDRCIIKLTKIKNLKLI